MEREEQQPVLRSVMLPVGGCVRVDPTTRTITFPNRFIVDGGGPGAGRLQPAPRPPPILVG
ncbi:hypothetical protein BH23ACT10_BH23ACT10_35590 [soil metagenome]